MLGKPFLTIFRVSIFLFFAFPLAAAAPVEVLEKDDVHEVMEQILQLHVSDHQLSAPLVERSFRVFVNHFDPDRIYLTKEEIAPYWNPSSELVQKTLEEYQQENYHSYEEMIALFQKGILRSQELRVTLQQELEPLFVEVEEEDAEEVERLFAENESDLRDNTLEQMRRFLRIQQKLVGAEDPETQRQIVSFYEKRMQEVENDYLYLDAYHKEVNPKQKEHFLVLQVLKALAKSLDSHTAFFSPMEAYDMKLRLEKGFDGLGIVLQETIHGIIVTRLIEDGPADQSGLVHENDHIISIDGEDVRQLPFKKVLDLIRGHENTPVVLGLVKEGSKEGEVQEVKIMRGKVVLNDERVEMDYEWYGDGIVGVITLNSFYEGEEGVSSERDMRDALRELKRVGKLKGLVLDLRENSGGFLQQAVKVAGLFIRNGVVVVSKYSDGQKRFFRDVDGHRYYDGPLVVLVSKASASAAEIVAQALQDYGAALVLGDERTYGKGSIQHQTVTSGESPSFFKVTVGRYYTVSGQSTQIRGVRADIIVPSIYSSVSLGEEYLDYPLVSDTIAASFDDSLKDVDPSVRRWFTKYYSPTLQERITTWKSMLPVLKRNSLKRIEENRNFQLYLARTHPQGVVDGSEIEIEKELDVENEEITPGIGDLQLAEAVNIVKDMVLLRVDQDYQKMYAALNQQEKGE